MATVWELIFTGFKVLDKRAFELGERPILEERGPYVYHLSRKRVVKRMSKDQTEIDYEESTYLNFDAVASNGTEVSYLGTLGS